MNIIIPMAGSGKRFSDVGYRLSKPVIQTIDRHSGDSLPMVVCAVRDLYGVNDDGSNIIFIDRDYHKSSGVEREISSNYPRAKFITLDKLSEGQACTVLLTEEALSDDQIDDEMLIASCDNGMEYDKKNFETTKSSADVLVFTFRNDERVMLNPNAYGWIACEDSTTKVVSIVSVKKALSQNPMRDHAIVGTFWFKSGKSYFKLAKQMIAANDRINNEFYIDLVIKYALAQGLTVKAFEIDRYIGWGTPVDYENYQNTIIYWQRFNFRRTISKLSYEQQKSNVINASGIKSYVIGISGDSGSGKSTLDSALQGCIPDSLLIEGDSYHKWARGEEPWKFSTHLAPISNYLYRAALDLYKLRNGLQIMRTVYDHSLGKFTEPRKVSPRNIIIASGLHTLYMEELRENLDFKIYIDTSETLKTYWKLMRDKIERNLNVGENALTMLRRKPDFNKYIEPQKKFADLVIEYFDNNEETLFAEEREASLGVRFKVYPNCNVSHILKIFRENAVKHKVFFKEPHQIIELNYDEITKFPANFGINNFSQAYKSTTLSNLMRVVTSFVILMIDLRL
jgi:uridine kinase/dTDP-glucose pyrophosphorylase